MKKPVLTLLILIVAYQAHATNYFFSNSGNDSNSGKSPSSPWRSISKLKSISLKPGDSILLNRGDSFEGAIEIKKSGTSQNPIVIAAYGEGPKPILTGARRLSGWKDDSGLLTARIGQTATDFYVNGLRQTIARYPNKGYITIDTGYNKKTIQSERIKDIPGDVKGATARIRSIDWAYETRIVKSATANTIGLVYHNLYKTDNSYLPRIENGATTLYDLKKGYGFYVEGLPQFIDTAGEWNMRGKDIVFKPLSNSASPQNKFEAAVERTGINILSGVKHIVISDVQIEKYYHSALNTGARVENISVNNCKIKDIHLFGIRMDSLSRNCKIINNNITDVLGTGVSAIEPEKMLVENNVVKRIGIVPGQGLSGVGAASGIMIYNHEHKFLKSKYASHNQVRLNKVDSCGYVGIRVDGGYNLVEYNVMLNCGLTLNDGGAFYTYGKISKMNHHLTLRRNIVQGARGNIDGTPANHIVFNGIYIDNFTSDCLVEENTLINNSSCGIQNNAAAFNNTYTKNNVFNCGTGIGFFEWGDMVGLTYGNKVFENTVVAHQDTNQVLIRYNNYVANSTNFGEVDNNHYIHTTNTNPFYTETKQAPLHSKLLLPFNYWQRIANLDLHSTAILGDNELLNSFCPEIIVNEALTEKEYVFEKDNYRDSKGEVFTGPVKLGASQSIIVLKKR